MPSFSARRLGLASIVATLMLVWLAVAAAIIAYSFTASLIASFQVRGGQQVWEQLQLESWNYPTDGTLTLAVSNVGGNDVTVDSIYVDGEPKSFTGGPIIPIRQSASFTLTAGGCTKGSVHHVTIATKAGGIFVWAVTCARFG